MRNLAVLILATVAFFASLLVMPDAANAQANIASSRAAFKLAKAVAPGPGGARFCLQQFNTYGPAYAAQLNYRTIRLTEELLSEPVPCDVMQFQEAWKTDHIQQLMDAFTSIYQISAPNLQARIGLMSFFRGQMTKTETYPYQVNNEGGLLDGLRDVAGVKKAFHVVTAKLPQLPEEIFFLNTHLHPTSTAVRISQILDIYNWRLQNQSLKLVLSGDFNAEINSVERALLMKLLGLHDSLEEVLGRYPEGFCSYCESNVLSWLWGNHLFDYVFYSNISDASQTNAGATSLTAAAGEINLKGETYDSLSDHFGVRVELELKPGAALADDEGSRKATTLEVLQQALDSLAQDGSPALTVYVQELKQVRKELKAGQGPHFSYWQQYR